MKACFPFPLSSSPLLYLLLPVLSIAFTFSWEINQHDEENAFSVGIYSITQLSMENPCAFYRLHVKCIPWCTYYIFPYFLNILQHLPNRCTHQFHAHGICEIYITFCYHLVPISSQIGGDFTSASLKSVLVHACKILSLDVLVECGVKILIRVPYAFPYLCLHDTYCLIDFHFQILCFY